MFRKSNLSRLKKIFSNKYLLATTAFLVWMLFFDRNNIMDQYQLYRQLQEAKQKSDYYNQEIKKTENEKRALTSNPAALEQFAREKYHMKKDNEDEFVILPDSSGK